MPPPLAKGQRRPKHWKKPGPKKLERGVTPQKRWYRRNRAKVLANLRAKNARMMHVAKESLQEFPQGIAVTTGAKLDEPWLRYIDAAGRIHVEKELSAEQLIRAWKKAQRKGRKKNA